MSETVFNEGSVDVDFRVEGSTATHAFFVEGETDRVGLLTNDPTHTLVVKTHSSGTVNAFKVEEKDSTDALVHASFANSHDEGSVGIYYGGTLKNYFRGNGDSYINGGNLGIGTASPGENVHIYSSASAATTLKIEANASNQRADIALYGNYTGSDADFAEILFVNNGDSVGAIQSGRDGDPAAGNIKFTTQAAGGGMTERMRITSSGHFLPATNNAYDLGSSSLGWRNIYTNDLNLSNIDSDGNDIDGTRGSWTIQEGKEDLFLINRTNKEKYKFKLEKV